MDERTRLALNAINHDFYARHAQEFGATRARPWPGWRRILAAVSRAVSSDASLSVLDLGCGNGRFALALQQFSERPLEYIGIDSSQELLLEAGQALASFKTARLVEHDVVSAPTTDILPARAAAGHDLVVLFGLLHHVPQAERRRALITACAERLRTGGLLAVSFWQYAGRERFDRKIVPWQWAAEHYGIDPADLEAGDTLLSWGRGSQGVRYCHFISRQEAAALLSLDDLVNIDSFDADGETGDLNHYVLMRRLGGRGARPGT